MNLRYCIDPEQRIGVVTCFDVLTIALFQEGMRRLTTDPLWRPGFGELWDCSQATDLRVGPDALKGMAEIDQSYTNVVGASAMVFSSFSARSIAQSYFSLFPMGRPTRVFSSIEEARAWLVHTVAESDADGLDRPTNP